MIFSKIQIIFIYNNTLVILFSSKSVVYFIRHVNNSQNIYWKNFALDSEKVHYIINSTVDIYHIGYLIHGGFI